jgi:hypothetical protein
MKWVSEVEIEKAKKMEEFKQMEEMKCECVLRECVLHVVKEK